MFTSSKEKEAVYVFFLSTSIVVRYSTIIIQAKNICHAITTFDILELVVAIAKEILIFDEIGGPSPNLNGKQINRLFKIIISYKLSSPKEKKNIHVIVANEKDHEVPATLLIASKLPLGVYPYYRSYGDPTLYSINKGQTILCLVMRLIEWRNKIID
ncbi:hypothetical protein ACJX0J_021031 [Zea mays]